MSTAASAGISEGQDERFYRIGEVSRLTGVPPFVLRYWEEELPMLAPLKSPAGYRLYRQQDLDLIGKIKRLLYDEGLTLAGVRRHLRDLQNGAGLEAAVEQLSTAANVSEGEGEAVQLNRKMLLDLRDALRSFLTLFEGK
ncbi:MAG TPA: MerR family transcriptional regulator [Candidatus Eisenbacteria bacterium]|nr:MerR family transcriptional regulator [Candidatus Eisenbacteria bacterium]